MAWQSNKILENTKILAAVHVFVCITVCRFLLYFLFASHCLFIFIALYEKKKWKKKREKYDVHDLWILLETNRSNPLKGRRDVPVRHRFFFAVYKLCSYIYLRLSILHCTNLRIYWKFSLIFQMKKWFGQIVVMLVVHFFRNLSMKWIEFAHKVLIQLYDFSGWFTWLHKHVHTQRAT